MRYRGVMRLVRLVLVSRCTPRGAATAAHTAPATIRQRAAAATILALTGLRSRKLR